MILKSYLAIMQARYTDLNVLRKGLPSFDGETALLLAFAAQLDVQHDAVMSCMHQEIYM